ncbi:TPA: hypothetical protein ACNV0U_005343 [Klebsiella variicola]|uniref:hypothetical protein n=1 Tax=Klebsiella variicola TaxID=244366 RepID=UPI001146EBCE|nr:hypothetical protein [Klebsiella variicola]HCB0793846.1 hypothetical protein [Klebsiella variicola subsp. variicola]EIW9274085.1 hypothetical protein [Klebsiella variicola]ELC9130396.1 hypothetical protein [Klebsiella variicola]MBG2046802.1 hypothetical protein [Klebsiella variicola]MBR7370291.1 hypothetical protein [Klebsiella variicola]
MSQSDSEPDEWPPDGLMTKHRVNDVLAAQIKGHAMRSPVIRIYFFKSGDIIALPELNHQVSNFCMSP